jgi:hypothetical protein
MDGSWHVIRWIWVAICFIWIVVQVVALRRLRGDLKRQSWNVFWVVFVLMMVSDWIRDAFENPMATRIGMLAVGVAAIAATVVLIRLLRTPGAGNIADEPDVDGHVKSLNLS